MKECPVCRQEAERTAARCRRCGHVFGTAEEEAPPAHRRQRLLPPTPDHVLPPCPPGHIQAIPGTHPVLSTTVASLLLPGAGQALNRQAIKGMLWFLVAALAFWQIRHLAGIPFIALWLLGGVDAQRIAGRLNRGETVSPWQCF